MGAGKDIDHNSLHPKPSSQNNIPKRIGTSASGLLQASFQRPSPSSVTEALAAMNSETAKGGPSSSTTSTTSPSSISQSSFTPPVLAHSFESKSFRSQASTGESSGGNGQTAFDEFISEPEESSVDFRLDGDVSTLGEQAFPYNVAEGSQGKHFPEIHSINGRQASGVIEEASSAKSNDGAAVLTLLSNPEFSADGDPSENWDLAVEEQNGRARRPPHPLGAPQKTLNAMALSNPLDLIPDFDPSWTSFNLSSGPAEHDRKFTEREILDFKFGDLRPWVNMLGRYHDEVWGDMLPLVQEAREEAKAAKLVGSGSLRDRPAIRRLAMLLRHLNHTNGP